MVGQRERLAFSTWNMRSFLLSQNQTQYQAKQRIVTELLIKSDVLALQEAHGSQRDIDRFCERQSNTHQGQGIAHRRNDSGGVLLFIRNDLLGSSTEVSFEVLAQGRAMYGEARANGTVVAAINVHNFDLSEQERAKILKKAKDVKQEVRKDATGKSILIMLGDWNFSSIGEAPIR